MSVVRIALQAPSPLPLRPLLLYCWPLWRSWPPSSLPLPLLPLSEGRGVTGEALGVSRVFAHASSCPSSCIRSRGDGGGGGGRWRCGWDWGCLSWSFPHRGGGGGSAEIPPSQPSPVLARSPPLPGPSELLVRDSRSRSCNSGIMQGMHPRTPCLPV